MRSLIKKRHRAGKWQGNKVLFICVWALLIRSTAQLCCEPTRKYRQSYFGNQFFLSSNFFPVYSLQCGLTLSCISQHSQNLL